MFRVGAKAAIKTEFDSQSDATDRAPVLHPSEHRRSLQSVSFVDVLRFRHRMTAATKDIRRGRSRDTRITLGPCLETCAAGKQRVEQQGGGKEGGGLSCCRPAWGL